MPIQEDSEKRFCAVCQSHVYKTNTYEELQSNIAAKRCVAIFLEDPMGSSLAMMGDVQSIPDLSSDAYVYRSVDELSKLFDEAHLNLSTKITDTLKTNGITLIGDLSNCTDTRLSAIFESSPSSVNEIKEVIAILGVMIERPIANWDSLSAGYR